MTSGSSGGSAGWRAEPAALRLTALDARAPAPLGHPAADWLGPGFLSGHLHPAEREDTLALLHAVAADGRTRGARVRLAAADGRWVPVHLTAHAVPGAEGALLFGTLTWQDAEAGHAADPAPGTAQCAERLCTLLDARPDPAFFKDGEGRWLEVSRAALQLFGLEGGECRGHTDAEQAELERAQQQLVERERLAALGELAAVLAHEVRNPLGAITNALAAARRGLRPAPEHAYLFDIIDEEAARLHRLVSDLLDFARPYRPEVRPHPLAVVVEEAVGAALRGQAGSGAVHVRVEVAEDLPPVPLDAQLVHLALVNVCANALQAMPDGGQLAVTATREGAWVRLVVRDSGPGIPPAHRERVFEPFFTTRSLGTGLGLPIVRRILQSHGGSAEVEPSGSPGTAVVLRLPLPPPAR